MVYKDEVTDDYSACSLNIQKESDSAVEAVEEIPAHVEDLVVEGVALDAA